jgi:hypothetical protein
VINGLNSCVPAAEGDLRNSLRTFPAKNKMKFSRMVLFHWLLPAITATPPIISVMMNWRIYLKRDKKYINFSSLSLMIYKRGLFCPQLKLPGRIL